jgi:hypothetical protein
MLDLLYVVIVLLFFWVSAAFTRGCDTLLED